MIDYTYFYKSSLPVDDPWILPRPWDVFISAFNSSERVSGIFDKADATKKKWLILPDYKYGEDEYPKGEFFHLPTATDEAHYVKECVADIDCDWATDSICIDITGFIKPYLMYLIRYLGVLGARKLDIIYSEPDIYAEKEETTFSSGSVQSVRQVYGYENGGSGTLDSDLLILGAGYDHKLISYAAQHKEKARKRHLFGLPSLQPAFYQENILRAQRSFEESLDGRQAIDHFDVAPANDPFAVASKIREIAAHEDQRETIRNLYLCPLATKPQAVGFILYYMWDCLFYKKYSASILYPFSDQHERATSKGISKIWKYEIELPDLT